MKKVFVICVLAILLVGVSSGAGEACSRKEVSGASQIIDPSRGINQRLLNRAILAEVNYERCRNGLHPLSAEPRLVGAAEGHSKWMAKARNVTHKSTIAGRRSPRDRIKRTGIKARTGAENIGMVHRYQVDDIRFIIRNAKACHFVTRTGKRIAPHSYSSLARTIVGYWMRSRGHRANILNAKFTRMGTAAAHDRRAEYCGTYYITQNFTG